ncbi:MAG: class I SAM-dependent methyltransferase [Nostoc sp. EkiNYC01]|nr:class I SAM-dependent methyltransferase [Nostoc sp. EkiNYC01]
MKRLKLAVAEFLAVENIEHSDFETAYHRIIAAMHSLCFTIREVELAGYDQDTIHVELEPVRSLYSKSPFVHRLQSWPRGYPGDFESIEYICNCVNKAASGTMAYYIEHHTLRTPSAQQHRNKIAWQAQHILETAFSCSQPRILSIACGSSIDIRSIESMLSRRNLSLFLNDMDADALEHSVRYLPLLASVIELVPGDVFKATKKFRSLAPLDLIVVGGLFDYLSDRQITWLLPKLYSILAIGGRICFTNLAQANPDRVWLQYIANWILIERSAADIERLVSESGLTDLLCLSITRDKTGLTLLVELQNTRNA